MVSHRLAESSAPAGDSGRVRCDSAVSLLMNAGLSIMILSLAAPSASAFDAPFLASLLCCRPSNS